MSTQPVPHYTLEEYLEIDRNSEYKNEFIDGGIFAMARPSLNHEAIVVNTVGALHGQLADSPSRMWSGGVRVYVAEYRVGTYPDLSVTCGGVKLLDQSKDSITDATLIVEVLSPSTQDYDHGAKFRYYRGLPSFAEYLLLAQDTMRLETYVRQPDRSWVWREYTDRESRIELKSIGCELVLKDLYARVEFETA